LLPVPWKSANLVWAAAWSLPALDKGAYAGQIGGGVGPYPGHRLLPGGISGVLFHRVEQLAQQCGMFGCIGRLLVLAGIDAGARARQHGRQHVGTQGIVRGTLKIDIPSIPPFAPFQLR
jgi:hypothetical protein